MGIEPFSQDNDLQQQKKHVEQECEGTEGIWEVEADHIGDTGCWACSQHGSGYKSHTQGVGHDSEEEDRIAFDQFILITHYYSITIPYI